jgi:hypothetical protein
LMIYVIDVPYVLVVQGGQVVRMDILQPSPC